MKKAKIISIIFILLLTANIYAQKENGITFPVNATGSVKFLADNINIRIDLGVERKDPQVAFDEHKLKEKKILKLIKKYAIPDKDISYSLFDISKNQNFKDKKITFKTYQTINFRLKDFNKYTPLQVDLLKNGIYEFSSSYETTKREEGHEKSVRKALNNARKEAELYAKNLNMKVGKIVSIKTNNNNIFARGGRINEVGFFKFKGIENIPQFISISTNIKVVYKLIKK